MHVVFLVSGWWPDFTPTGVCAEKIVARMKDGFDVSVLAVRQSQKTKEMSFVRDGVSVYQVADFIMDGYIQAKTRFSKYVWRHAREVASVCRLEDVSHWVARDMFAKLRQIESSKPINAIVSVGFPIATHEAAMMFKKWKPGIKWITYSTDTNHGNITRKKMLRPFRERAEKKCYIRADANFFSKEIYDTCGDFFGSTIMAKSKPLDYMIDLRGGGGNCAQTERPFPSDEFALVFGGAFVEGVRSPQYMLQVLERLPPDSRIHWHVYSNQGFRFQLETFAAKHPNRLVLHDPIPLDTFRKVLCGSDILVNISNDLNQFFPSKAFEYVATGRPIVDIAYPGRAENEVFRRYPRHLRIEIGGNPDVDARRLVGFCMEQAGCRIRPESLAKVYSDYLPENVLAPLFHEIAARGE